MFLPVDIHGAEVLGRIADHKITRIHELLPWRYAAAAAYLALRSRRQGDVAGRSR